MKNKNFFFLQYNKINWPNQQKTKINQNINNYIIEKIINQNTTNKKIFDIGFGIGFFINMALKKLNCVCVDVIVEGCEPSKKNYSYFKNNQINVPDHSAHTFYNTPFLKTKTSTKFNFITAIYVFPHFIFEEIENVVKKINTMLEMYGKFFLVVADECYLKKKLKKMRDLFIEKNTLFFNGKSYWEVLHYSDIPKIGTIIDYNREKQFYFDLFGSYYFKLESEEIVKDNGFASVCFIFQKIGEVNNSKI